MTSSSSQKRRTEQRSTQSRALGIHPSARPKHICFWLTTHSKKVCPAGFILPICDSCASVGAGFLLSCSRKDEHNAWTPYPALFLWYWFGPWNCNKWIDCLKQIFRLREATMSGQCLLRPPEEVCRSPGSQPLTGRASGIVRVSLKPFTALIHIIV